MMKGAKSSVLEALGGTPIVRLNRVGAGLAAELYAKLEYMNPGGSTKDRVGLNIVNDAERRGLLKPGGTIVEATSGNTGMGLALGAAVRGYKCIFVMPDKMSEEKIGSLRAFGARVVVCPTNVAPEDPRSYYSVSRKLVQETKGAFYANQYHNPANPEAHYVSTAPEIWQQTGGEIDVFVAAMGTGGTISGCARYFKEHKPSIRIVGVDPIGSVFHDFVKTGLLPRPFSYKVEGFGEDFLPSTMDLKVVDEIVRVDDKECFLTARDLVRLEGLYAGGSSGAAVAGAVRYAGQAKCKENIVVLLPDGAQKYVSKVFNDAWMRENGFLEEDEILGTVADLLRLKPAGHVITAQRTDTVRHVIDRMKDHGISQLPVVENGRLCGVVSEVDLLKHLLAGPEHRDDPIGDLVEGDFATVTPRTKVSLIHSIIGDAKMVVVLEGDTIGGVITKIDLIDYLASKRPA